MVKTAHQAGRCETMSLNDMLYAVMREITWWFLGSGDGLATFNFLVANNSLLAEDVPT